MSPFQENTTLLRENNWAAIMQEIKTYPVRISEIKQLNKEIVLTPLSFKYNLSGSELYFNGNKQIKLHTGEYLLAANQHYCEVDISETDSLDLGLCIDVNLEVMKQALVQFFQPNQIEYYSESINYFEQASFFLKFNSNKYFHSYLLQLFHQIKHNCLCNLHEIQLDFIHKLLFEQLPSIKSYKQIPSIKQATKSELFERMYLAKQIMHDEFRTLQDIPELASKVYLSEYRFYHIFKETFQVSPYQYLIQLKMEEAINLFVSGQYTWTEVSRLLNFTDLPTFSKQFKKFYRISPTTYAKGITNNTCMR